MIQVYQMKEGMKMMKELKFNQVTEVKMCLAKMDELFEQGIKYRTTQKKIDGAYYYIIQIK
jgi:hypothetical protein